MKSGIVDSLHKVIGEMVVLAMVSVGLLSSGTSAQTGGGTAPGVAVGAQYDSAHVYLSPADLDAFVASFTATFGGTASKKSVTNVLPVPSTTEFQYVWTPVGTLSVFAYETAIPFPFGSERTGYLVTDMDEAIREAHSAGAEVIVEPFRDPIGRDAVIQWPGGVKMQLYWHTAPPKYGALATTPENRVYISRDAADAFVGDFLAFSQGKVVGDDPRADGGEIGRRGETYRCIRITSHFGNMRVLVTDGHLPYPFGHEVMGYEVGDLTASLARAKAAGAKVLAAPYASKEGASVIVQFPGGYVVEIHAAR